MPGNAERELIFPKHWIFCCCCLAFDHVFLSLFRDVISHQEQVETNKREKKDAQAELCRSKVANEELADANDTMQRENKNLALEVKDLLDQIGEGGRP